MFDLGEAEGTHYITMEYVSGEDLKNMTRMSGQLGLATAISVARQVAEGLEEAHKLGIVHRDLKPQNIMIDRDGKARIMDFGIARSLKGQGITRAGTIIGTPEYMSPAQVEGRDVEQRSDIYSLGVILYEMLTGRVPFEGDAPFTVGVKIRSEVPRDPKEFNPQIPLDLSRLLLKCLEEDRQARYQDAREVHEELQKIEKRIPTAARIIPPTKPATSKEITVTFKLNPNSPLAMDAYLNMLATQGHFDEAVVVLKRALELDPLSPALHYELGWIYWASDRIDQGIPHLRRAVELDRNFLWSRQLLAFSYQLSCRSAEASAEFQTLAQLAPDLPFVRGSLGYFYGVTGHPEEARKILGELDQMAHTRYVGPWARAMIYLGLGQKGAALDWLEKACEEHHGWMLALSQDPWYAPLRNEPRFQALLKKIRPHSEH